MAGERKVRNKLSKLVKNNEGVYVFNDLTLETPDGTTQSIVQFNRFLEETNPEDRKQLKTYILGYNRDDVIATRRQEEWLMKHFVY